MLRFTIRGKIKPYVRMTRRGKWVSAQAQEYLASKDAIQSQLLLQLQQNDWDELPQRTPLAVRLWVTVPERLHCSDLDNIVKAVLDAAQGIVYRNDLWIDSIRARRRLGDEHCAILEVDALAAIGAR